MPEAADEELVRMYLEGNMEAFEELYRRYKEPVYRFVYRMCAGGDLAADITQEVFVKMVRHVAGFAGRSRFSTWLFSLARNAALDRMRRAAVRRAESLDAAGEEGRPLSDRVPDGSAVQPDAAVACGDMAAAVRRAIDALPDAQREVFVLRQYHAVPFADIAAMTGVPEGTVKSRMRYALAALRQALAPWMEDDHD